MLRPSAKRGSTWQIVSSQNGDERTQASASCALDGTRTDWTCAVGDEWRISRAISIRVYPNVNKTCLMQLFALCLTGLNQFCVNGSGTQF